MNQPTSQLAASRFRGLAIIWLAQIASLVMLSVLAFVLRPSATSDERVPATTLVALAVAALGALAAAFFLRARFASRAVFERRPDLVTTGHVIAFALCEACGVIGLVTRFATAAPEATYFFVAALVGFLLLFPRRAQIEAATTGGGQDFKTTL
ncbi:MAG: hypothetical protein ABR563_11060 [Pyrinomonadaceae bacterium]